MVFTEQLPKIKDLRRLSKEIRNFPITGFGIVQCAEHSGYDEETLDFLKRFSKRLVFQSRTDFINHCGLLEDLVRQERASLPEHLRSPQD